MKKLSQLFFVLAMLLSLTFVACGSDDDNKDGDGLEIQDYTSFVIENKYTETVNLYYTIVAYKDDKGVWRKLADIGHLENNKPSKEVKLTKYYKEVRLFCVLERITSNSTHYYDFDLKENRKNILIVENATQWTAVKDKDDPKQYPQE